MTPAELVASADAVILDFDGPMCDVFAAHPAREVAQELAAFTEEIWSHHGESFEGQLPDTDDPFEILRAAAARSVPLAGYVSDRLRELETTAAKGAPPTDGLVEFLDCAQARGQVLAVASNNSVEAIKHWLEIQGLDERFSHVGGRTTRSDRLKPNPFVLHETLSALGIRADRCVFIGDSLSDLDAARAVSIPFVAFADKPHKPAEFRKRGCDRVVTRYAQLSEDTGNPGR